VKSRVLWLLLQIQHGCEDRISERNSAVTWGCEKLLTAKGAKVAQRSRREAILDCFRLLEHGKQTGMGEVVNVQF